LAPRAGAVKVTGPVRDRRFPWFGFQSLLGANDKSQAAGYYSMSQNKLNP
jgi:hypothetical protein